MKTSKMTLLFPLLFAAISYGADQNTAIVGYKENKNDQFEKILEKIPEAKTQYDACIAHKDIGMESLEYCLMHGTNYDKDALGEQEGAINGIGKGGHLSAKQDVLKKIQEIVSEPQYSNTKSNQKGYDSFETLTSSIDVNDAAYKKLHEYMSKKLEEALYGEYKKAAGSKVGSKQRMVKHADFNVLFKNQVSNNILSAISSYCISADPDMMFTLPSKEENRKSTVEKNINNLQEIGTRTYQDGSKGPEMAKASIHYTDCMEAIPNICYGEGKYSEKSLEEINQNRKDAHAASKSKETLHLITLEHSKNEACLVTNFLRKSRQQLIAIENLDENYNELAKKGSAIGIEVQLSDGNGGFKSEEMDVYDGDKSKKQISIQELSIVTSKEAIEESGFDKANESLVKNFEENCYADEEIKDTEACKAYIGLDKDKQKELFAENILRQKGMEGRLQNELAEGPDGIVNYLVDEGYDKDEALKMAQENEEEIRARIQDRFKAEKEALIASMAKKIDGNTAKTSEVTEDDTKTIQTIGTKLTDRTENLKQLLHFNNIVTSYLKVSNQGSEESSQNTIAFDREIASSSYKADDQEYADKLKEAREQSGNTGRAPTSSNASSTTITSDTINKLLKYFGSDEEEK